MQINGDGFNPKQVYTMRQLLGMATGRIGTDIGISVPDPRDRKPTRIRLDTRTGRGGIMNHNQTKRGSGNPRTEWVAEFEMDIQKCISNFRWKTVGRWRFPFGWQSDSETREKQDKELRGKQKQTLTEMQSDSLMWIDFYLTEMLKANHRERERAEGYRRRKKSNNCSEWNPKCAHGYLQNRDTSTRPEFDVTINNTIQMSLQEIQESHRKGKISPN